MEVNVRHGDSVIVFQLRGQIFGPAVSDLKKVIDEQLVNISDAPKLLFDFADVSMIDSSGFGALMRTHVSIAPAGGRMAFINAGTSLKNRIVRFRLITILQHFDTEDDAIASLTTDNNYSRLEDSYGYGNNPLTWSHHRLPAPAESVGRDHRPRRRI
jgi:anti-anti-sigma factor